MSRIEQIWIELRSSLWFLPSLLVLGSVLLAYALIRAHTLFGTAWFQQWPYLFGAEADGARGMLTAIATSIITVAGVTFSITVAALAQASSQYSPLILRNFMRDRANQVVLGVFGGIFVYCLIVLRSIRSGDPEFVPSLAVTVALVHAIAAIGFLLFFIHHIASILQASSVLAMVSADTRGAIEAAFPDEILDDDVDSSRTTETSDDDGLSWYAIAADRTGYIQSIRPEPMIEFACHRDATLRMEHGIGDFVVEGLPLVSIALPRGSPTEEDADALRELFVIGQYRTIDQDVGFGIRQIVDMGVKALSPGINDPTTACACLDYLSAILLALGNRRTTLPAYSVDGKTRLLAHGPTYADLAGLAFDQIREHARGDSAVLLCLAEVIERTGAHVRVYSRVAVMRHQLTLLEEHAGRHLPAGTEERERVERRIRLAAGTLARAGSRAHAGGAPSGAV